MTDIDTRPALIDITATLHTPLHHGAGTAGNTAILRTHDVIQPDGTTARVPYLSGNSIRNRIRSHLAWRLIEILDVQPGTLTKPVVDLLWSGGAITATGAQVDLGIARDVEILIPHVAMLGYAARSDIVGGTLRARDWLLVCAENAWRLPAHLRDGKRAAAYRGEEFGTRHDIASTPVARLIATVGDLLGDHLPTTQMIYDRQVLLAGARMWGTLDLTPAATPAHRTALEAALALWAPDGVAHVGANTAQGRGVVHLDGLPDTRATALAEWEGALTGRRDEILGLLAQVTG